MTAPQQSTLLDAGLGLLGDATRKPTNDPALVTVLAGVGLCIAALTEATTKVAALSERIHEEAGFAARSTEHLCSDGIVKPLPVEDCHCRVEWSEC